MTELLYHQDSYLKSFPAAVTDTVPAQHGVVLDRTAFFPGGGGQPPDNGELHFLDQTAAVLRAKRIDGAVVHLIQPDHPLPAAGDEVEGLLNWELRYQLMRTHTAMHILCGVIFRDYGASVTGGNMNPLQGRMDFEFKTMTKDLVEEIELAINQEVENARPVTWRTLPREEAFKIPDLIRTKINLLPEHIREVRVVEIEGLDLQADGGTHVRNTEEVGSIQIVDYKSKGADNKRIYLELPE
jgi:misacylated tRNA(Ala) deacylase